MWIKKKHLKADLKINKSVFTVPPHLRICKKSLLPHYLVGMNTVNDPANALYRKDSESYQAR